MLSIAVLKHQGKAIDKQTAYLFLYYTECGSTGADDCAPIYEPAYVCI